MVITPMLMAEDNPELGTDLPEEELGRLCRFVAHDFKNFTMLLAGNAEMALRRSPTDPQVCEYLGNIIEAAKQARDLADKVLVHRRHNPAEEDVIDLVPLVEQLPALVGGHLSDSLSLEIALEDRPLPWRGSPARWQQVMLNLVVNAIEAMEGRSGRVQISARRDGNQIVFAVEDDGPGVPHAIRDSIFDAEKTTRRGDLHQGLGLAIVRHLAETYGGTVSVGDSQHCAGACFTVCVPAAAESDLPATASGLLRAVKAPTVKHNVLYVEDEPSMRTLGLDMLQMLNCRVTLAADGQEALEIFERSPDYFDIIISDSRMPNVCGSDLAQRVTKIRTDIPFILVTAFNDAATGPDIGRLGIREVLRKPFMLEDLDGILKRILAAS